MRGKRGNSRSKRSKMMAFNDASIHTSRSASNAKELSPFNNNNIMQSHCFPSCNKIRMQTSSSSSLPLLLYFAMNRNFVNLRAIIMLFEMEIFKEFLSQSSQLASQPARSTFLMMLQQIIFMEAIKTNLCCAIIFSFP